MFFKIFKNQFGFSVLMMKNSVFLLDFCVPEFVKKVPQVPQNRTGNRRYPISGQF